MNNLNSNYLNIPQSTFGTSGIEIGNIIYRCFQEGELKAQYDPVSKRVVILNSSNLSPDALNKILYCESLNSNYYGWFPKVKKKRDSDGNLLIKFSPTCLILYNIIDLIN